MHTLFDGPEARAEDAARQAIARAQSRQAVAVPTFDEFWAAWPKREAKKDARRAWDRLTSACKIAALAALPAHVARWRIAGTARNFIPHPATWLRGERWEDELGDVLPGAAARQAAQAGPPWWSSHALMERKAREVGVGPARPGEETAQYRARIQQAIEDRQRFGPPG